MLEVQAIGCSQHVIFCEITKFVLKAKTFYRVFLRLKLFLVFL